MRPAPSLTLACETVPELTPPCEVGRCLLRSSKHAARSVLLSQQGGTLAAAICETTGESPRGYKGREVLSRYGIGRWPQRRRGRIRWSACPFFVDVTSGETGSILGVRFAPLASASCGG